MSWDEGLKSSQSQPWLVGEKLLGQTEPLIMGVLNVTPDSFFDGGMHNSPERALAHAQEMALQGADLLDVGAESTRPGSPSISAEEEISRLKTIFPLLKKNLTIPLSIDTSKASVAQWAVQEGATVVNDISGLTKDPAMIELIAQSGVSVVINHIQGTPADMQESPHYQEVLKEVADFLSAQANRLVQAGVNSSKIAIDPGIGFGKTKEHNYALIKYCEELVSLGFPVLLGPSRKSFIGQTQGLENSDRLHPTTAVCLLAALKGVKILRVHDVYPVKEELLQIGAILSQ